MSVGARKADSKGKSMVELGEPKQREVALILPHEETLLREQLDALRSLHLRLADARQAAVAEGGDGWHDNAAYDAVNDEFKVLRQRQAPLQQINRDYEVVAYPEPDDDTVRIGSRVRLDMNGAEFLLDVVGESLFGRSSDDPDLEIATYQSPLARLVLGHKAGDICTGLVGEREATARIVSVDQHAQRPPSSDDDE